MKITKFTEKNFSSSNWSGGKTDELLILPANASYKDRNFSMRISSATVEIEKSNFTSLPGVTRFICPLDNKLKLFHATNNANDGVGTKPEVLADLKPFDVFKFSGDMPISSEGKCRDFNLMLKGACSGFMESWNTEQEAIKEFSVKENSFLWIFSYDVKAFISIAHKNRVLQVIEIDKMQLITVEGLYGRIELKTAKIELGESKNLLYGFCSNYENKF